MSSAHSTRFELIWAVLGCSSTRLFWRSREIKREVTGGHGRSSGRSREIKREIKQERPGELRSSQERPGEARRGQKRPGEARRGQEKPGAARRGQERPGELRRVQERPVEARRAHGETHGETHGYYGWCLGAQLQLKTAISIGDPRPYYYYGWCLGAQLQLKTQILIRNRGGWSSASRDMGTRAETFNEFRLIYTRIR